MSPLVEVLWVAGIIGMAFLVWLNAAKTEQRGREANATLDEIKRLLATPGTTLDDVKMAIGISGGVSAVSHMRVSLSPSPLSDQADTEPMK